MVKQPEEELEEELDDEIVQSTAMIDLKEQLQMIQTVKAYIKEFVTPRIHIDPSWISGYALQNEIYVTHGDESVYRCNMEAFYQVQTSGERKLVYLVNLIRFENESWKVFQVKEV